MKRFIQFIRMCWLHKSLSSARWVDSYDSFKPDYTFKK